MSGAVKRRHRLGCEPAEPSQCVQRHHRLHRRQPPHQIPGHAQHGSDRYTAKVDDLVAGEQVTVDGEARLLAEITTGHRQLSVRLCRCVFGPVRIGHRAVPPPSNRTARTAPKRAAAPHAIGPRDQLAHRPGGRCRETAGDTGGHGVPASREARAAPPTTPGTGRHPGSARRSHPRACPTPSRTPPTHAPLCPPCPQASCYLQAAVEFTTHLVTAGKTGSTVLRNVALVTPAKEAYQARAAVMMPR
jgi:hypothetical protein